MYPNARKAPWQDEHQDIGSLWQKSDTEYATCTENLTGTTQYSKTEGETQTAAETIKETGNW